MAAVRRPSRNATARKAQLQQVAMGDYGQTDWGETNPQKNPQYRVEFNKKRWENLGKQLEEIKQRWVDTSRPMFVVVTCETGYNHVVKVGIQCLPDCPSVDTNTLLREKQEEVLALMRGEGAFTTSKGRTAHGAGDLDVCLQVHGLDQLTVEHIQSVGNFSRVVELDIDPAKGQDQEDSSVGARKRLEGKTPMPGMMPTLLGQELPTGKTEQKEGAVPDACKHIFRKAVEDAKNEGSTKADLIKLIEELYDSVPSGTPAARGRNLSLSSSDGTSSCNLSIPPSDGTSSRSLSIRSSDGSSSRNLLVPPCDDSSSLESNLKLVRNSQGVAWLIFDLKTV